MADKIERKLNADPGREVSAVCSRCVGKTAHEIVASFDEDGSDDVYDYQWNNSYQILFCRGCKIVSFRHISSNSEDYVQVGHDEWIHDEHEALYPSRLEGRRDLGDQARLLPAETRQIYTETLQALSNHSPILAGIGLRALIETICKERKATGKNLLEKIDSLAEQRILTPGSANILHRIRTLGNAAAHEVRPHSEKQLGFAMDIVEHLLKDVYIIPKLVEQEFKE
ncbi:DUF4145 domain-containing protein [Burkholderia gladioli]|uniref:DUF4145 domain-containing protein n=1 Tax=Burkholderia gladioli TaxID=28095 RepID=UPI0016408BE5|nr:DUF4145 domain-containing protein [Burkholderia gladioli]